MSNGVDKMAFDETAANKTTRHPIISIKHSLQKMGKIIEAGVLTSIVETSIAETSIVETSIVEMSIDLTSIVETSIGLTSILVLQ